MTSSESVSTKLELEFKSMIQDEKKSEVLKLPQQEVVDELFASFAEDKRKHLVEFEHKYNFDFVNEVPLPEGRYEWYPVDPTHEDGDHKSETKHTEVKEAG